MTSKERVWLAVHHQEPDRVPVCATYVPEIACKLTEKYKPEGDLGVAMGNDMVKISSGLENSFYYRNTPEYTCPYGIDWRNVTNETGHFSEIIRHPLAGDNIEALLQYTPPKEAVLAAAVQPTRQAVSRYGKEKWVIGSCQCSLFEAAWYLRGLDTFLMDLAEGEDWVDAYLDTVMQVPLEMGLQFIELGVDMVWLGDDIATQRGMMLSPAMWRRYFKPRYAAMFQAFRKKRPDIVLCYHSCGNLVQVVDDFVEIGLDVLNPIQPMAMEPAAFKKRFGKQLTMYGTLDVQRVMPFGTPKQVQQEVRALIEACAPGGGFILSPAHHIQSDTRLENIEAFYQAARLYGVYNSGVAVQEGRIL